MADWLESRFETDRPVWTAVIGSASFANKLASEIEDTGIRGYKVVGYIGEELAGQPGAGPLARLARRRALGRARASRSTCW